MLQAHVYAYRGAIIQDMGYIAALSRTTASLGDWNEADHTV